MRLLPLTALILFGFAAPATALDLFPKLPELFTRTYQAKVAGSCDAKEPDRAQAAFEIGWLLLNARERDLAGTWIRRAAQLGHNRVAPLLKTLPAGKGVPPRCKGDAPLPGERAVFSVAPPETKALVRRIAPEHGMDPDLVLAVIAVESGFQADAVSPKNARGLMQLLPETAEDLRVADSFDPAQNIRGGTRYLAWLLKKFDNDLPLALAAYNAGPEAVRRFDSIPPYAETQSYVRSVQQVYERYKATNAKAPGGRSAARNASG